MPFSITALQPLLEWIESLSASGMYALMVALAFVEGVVPPIPGDLAAAFLAFISARSGGLWLPTTFAITVGSVGGSSITWWLGRRFGAEWLTHKLGRIGLAKRELKLERAEHRIEDAYQQYGWVALFLSRFIPGVRAVVPIAAGAMRVPLWETMGIMFLSSFIWYSILVWIAMKVGTDWEMVKAAMTTFAQRAGIGAIAVAAVVGGVFWWWWRRRRMRHK